MEIKALRSFLNGLRDSKIIDDYEIITKKEDVIEVHLKPKVLVKKAQVDMKDLVNSVTYNAINGIITHVNETIQQSNLDRPQALFVMSSIAESLSDIVKTEFQKDANNKNSH